jgi:hypothetical protein
MVLPSERIEYPPERVKTFSTIEWPNSLVSKTQLPSVKPEWVKTFYS